MSKIKPTPRENIENFVMKKVMNNEIAMKPRWYFMLGSALAILGLIGTALLSVFLINILFFLLRQHGPNGSWRLAGISLVTGVFLLRKYEFSYKNNFLLLILGFIITIVMTAFILDYSKLDEIWFQRGPMRRFYQQYQTKTGVMSKGQGKFR
jgi:uncharacterized membrane protein